MMACSCGKRRNNVSNECGKKIRAWQNIGNDVAKWKAGISGHRKGEICKRYQVLDFVRFGMNAASVGDEFRMLLKRVTSESSFEIFEKSSCNIGAKEKKQQQQQTPRRNERIKKITFSSRETFRSE